MAAVEGDVRPRCERCIYCVHVYVFVNYQLCLQSTKRPVATAVSQMAPLRGKTFLVSCLSETFGIVPRAQGVIKVHFRPTHKKYLIAVT